MRKFQTGDIVKYNMIKNPDGFVVSWMKGLIRYTINNDLIFIDALNPTYQTTLVVSLARDIELFEPETE